MQPNRQPDYPSSDLLGQVHVAVIRLDAKVDAIKDQIKEIRDLYNDHEKRIRQLEADQVAPSRIKALEDRDYVEAGTVWKVVGLVMSLATIGLTVLSMTR